MGFGDLGFSDLVDQSQLASWDPNDAFAQPVTSDTVPTDLSQATTAVDNSGTSSGWGGWLQSTVGQVLAYGLAKDKAQTQLQLQQQQQRALALQPVVGSANGSFGVNPMGLLLIGGIVLAVVLAEKG